MKHHGAPVLFHGVMGITYQLILELVSSVANQELIAVTVTPQVCLLAEKNKNKYVVIVALNL
jgi:RNA-binding protein YhbY